MINYYHFLKGDMTSAQGNEPPWVVGEHRQITGPVALCERGYHGSLHPYDALQYAPGPMLCLVELTGVIIEDTDKVVAQGRRLLKAVNIETQLRDFACNCTEEVLPLFERVYPDDKRPREAIEAMRQYNAGQITRDELLAVIRASEASARVAWVAAWAAAAAGQAEAAAAARQAGAAWTAEAATEVAWAATEVARAARAVRAFMAAAAEAGAAWVSASARAAEVARAVRAAGTTIVIKEYRARFKALCDAALAAPQDCELPKGRIK